MAEETVAPKFDRSLDYEVYFMYSEDKQVKSRLLKKGVWYNAGFAEKLDTAILIAVSMLEDGADVKILNMKNSMSHKVVPGVES